jgi:hypothetical protein
MEDFRNDKPGSEAVQEIMQHFGVFLRDDTRSYEAQALEALKASYRSKKELYETTVSDRQGRAAQAGITPNPEAFEENLRRGGFVTLRNEIETLQSRIRFLSERLEDDQEKPVHREFDLKRTVFLDDGTPKVFPTELALQMFLSDPGNEVVQERYEKMLAAEREANAGAK